MWIIPTKKEVKKEFKKISNSFKELKKELVSKKEIELMIRETTLKHYELRELSPRTTQTKYHRKAKIIADKVHLVNEIKRLLNMNMTTREIYDLIVIDNNLCKKTCFFKYLKIVREQSLRTSRTILTNKE